MKLLRRSITFPEKEFREEVARVEELVDELRSTLEEALEWIERPVETQQDAAYFLDFEERAKSLIAKALIA